MTLWAGIAVAVRRFYLTVPLVAAAIALAWLYTSSTPPEYNAVTSMLIVAPTAHIATDVPHPVNPYTSLGTATIATAMQIDTGSAQSLDAIRRAGNTTKFTVAEEGTKPIVDIVATSRSARQAMSTAVQLSSMIQASLAARQHTYAPNRGNQVTVQTMAPPAIEATVGNGKRKAQWVAIVVAVIAALVAVMAIDGRLRRRSEQLRDGGSDLDGAGVAPSGQVPVVE
ncbi:MAG: hypothetical protein QOG69_302 [Actinomycetota bacterium]|nr:hypothetical protein [Actinomycetota bacterium]